MVNIDPDTTDEIELSPDHEDPKVRLTYHMAKCVEVFTDIEAANEQDTRTFVMDQFAKWPDIQGIYGPWFDKMCEAIGGPDEDNDYGDDDIEEEDEDEDEDT